MLADASKPLYELQGSVQLLSYPHLRKHRGVIDNLSGRKKVEHGQNFFSFESYYISQSMINFTLFSELSKISCFQYNLQSVNNYKHLSKIDDALQLYYTNGVSTPKYINEYMKIKKFFSSNFYLFEECLLQLLKRIPNAPNEDSIYNTMKLLYILVSHKTPSEVMVSIIISELIPFSASEYLLIEENDFFSISSLTFNIIRKLKEIHTPKKAPTVKIIPSDQKIKLFLEIKPKRTIEGIIPSNYVLIYPISRLYWIDRCDWTIKPDYQFPGYKLDYDSGLIKSGRYFENNEILEGDSVSFEDIIEYFDTYYNLKFSKLTYKYGSRTFKSSLGLFDIEAFCNDKLINIAHTFYRKKENTVFKEDIIWKKQATKNNTLNFNFFFYKKFYCLLDNYIDYIDDSYYNYIKELYYQVLNDIKNSFIQLTERDDLIVAYIGLKIMFNGMSPCPSQILYKHIEQILPFNRIYKKSENEWKTEILQIAVNSPFVTNLHTECKNNVNRIRKKLLSYLSNKYSSFGTNKFKIKISDNTTNNIATLLINKNTIKLENINKELVFEWEFDKVNITNNKNHPDGFIMEIDGEFVDFSIKGNVEHALFWTLYNEMLDYKAETCLLATIF